MKKQVSIILALLLALTLCACGSSAEAPGAMPNRVSSEQAAFEEAALDMPAQEPMGEAFPASGAEKSDVTDIDPEKIIYSADITLETTEFDESIEKLTELIAQYEGYVESSSKSDASFYAKAQGRPVFRDAQYVIRIPSSKFSQISGDLSQLGNVPYSHSYTENVSAQYYDTEARLNAYTAQEKRLLEMLESAESIEDILAIEGQLTNVRYEIEHLQSSLNNWDRRVNYSTINLSVHEVSEYTDTPAPSLSYGQRLVKALKNGFYGVGNFFEDLLLFIVGSLPALIVIALIIFILRPVFKKLRAKRKERKSKKLSEKNDK